MGRTLKRRLSTGGPCADPIAGPSGRGSGSGVRGNTGYFVVQNTRQRNIASDTVRTARVVVRHRSDLTDPNSRAKEARLYQLGRVRDHRGGLPFGNSVWPFTRRECRWNEGGIPIGEYRPSSIPSPSGPMNRSASSLGITKRGIRD